MRFHYYDESTGLLHVNSVHTSIEDDEASLAFATANAPANHRAIAGEFDYQSQRVDITSGTVVDFQPPQPSANHEWDDISKRWRLSPDVSAREERKLAARARIAHLEANVQPRAIRELSLAQPEALKRLQEIDDEIAVLRRDLTE
jgi:hypothetical protein